MNRDLVFHNKIKNLFHTVGLLVIMASVTGLVAYMVMGPDGIWIAFISSAASLLLSRNISLERLLRTRGAQPLSPETHQGLYRIAATIAARAGLSRVPMLYYEKSGVMNAYASGNKAKPVIVLTDTLLRTLNQREIAGILGHETAHIKNNDLRVMAIAHHVQRITGFMSLFGQVILILALPLIISGNVRFSLAPLLFIIFAPTLVMMLQMALSRTREFEADVVASELTGDPAGLAQALYRLEKYHRYYWPNFFIMPWSYKAPAWLQTHPPTAQRINRIMELAGTETSRMNSMRYSQSYVQRPLYSPIALRHIHCINC